MWCPLLKQIHIVSLHPETAVNIGYSCKMLTDDMTEVFIISGHTVQSVRQELRLVHFVRPRFNAVCRYVPLIWKLICVFLFLSSGMNAFKC